MRGISLFVFAVIAAFLMHTLPTGAEGFRHVPVPYSHKYHGICQFMIDNTVTDCGEDMMSEEGDDNNDHRDVWTFSFTYKDSNNGHLIEVLFGGSAGVKDSKQKLFPISQTLLVDQEADKPRIFKSVGQCRESFGANHSFSCSVTADRKSYEFTFVGHDDGDKTPLIPRKESVLPDEQSRTAAQNSRIKYNGQCKLLISGKNENCAPSIVKSDDYSGHQPLHLFTTGFLSSQNQILVLAMAGVHSKKAEASYETSYAIESVALRHFKEKNDRDLHDGKGYCLWKEAGEDAALYCRFKSAGKSFEYTFKGSNSHDDGPLFPDFN